MLMSCFNKSPWTLAKHLVCDINHFSREKATLQYYPCVWSAPRDWQCGTFLNSPEVEIVVCEMPVMTKIGTRPSTRVSKRHAWLRFVHAQTQKSHISFFSLLFPVWQPCGSEGRRVAPHQYLPCSLLTNPFTVHLGWTGRVSLCSTVFLLLHLLQGY